MNCEQEYLAYGVLKCSFNALGMLKLSSVTASVKTLFMDFVPESDSNIIYDKSTWPNLQNVFLNGREFVCRYGVCTTTTPFQSTVGLTSSSDIFTTQAIEHQVTRSPAVSLIKSDIHPDIVVIAVAIFVGALLLIVYVVYYHRRNNRRYRALPRDLPETLGLVSIAADESTDGTSLSSESTSTNVVEHSVEIHPRPISTIDDIDDDDRLIEAIDNEMSSSIYPQESTHISTAESNVSTISSIPLPSPIRKFEHSIELTSNQYSIDPPTSSITESLSTASSFVPPGMELSLSNPPTGSPTETMSSIASDL